MSTDRLKNLLQAAVELELATIPPYLCALYSLRLGANDEARLIIRSVVVEEMLHMVLAANVLNAIGGQPRVADAVHAPRYPHELPDGVVLNLLPFCPEAVETFLKVENPEYEHHALGPDHPLLAGRPQERHVARAGTLASAPGATTIGAFYAEIIDGLKQESATIGEQALFCGDPARQVTSDYYYAGGGISTPVTDLASACKALDEIVEQGEGEIHSMYDDDGDLAHYFRFQQIKNNRCFLPSDDAGAPTGPPIGVDFEAVYPMIANPRSDEYTDPDLRGVSAAFNRTWTELLRQIDAAFNGHPEAFLTAVHAMFRLRDQALVLLANPLPSSVGGHAGPAFEWDPAHD